MPEGLIVSAVLPDSIAAEMELEAGDAVLQVDGHKVHDIIDLHYWTSENEFKMLVKKKNEEIWELEIEKGYGENLGIEVSCVSADGLKKCHNNCVFCFVQQMPQGMRRSLYDRDDDYRLSVTQGSYITLSNLTTEEFDRINNMHISPLYISVHAWDSAAREKLMRNRKAGGLSRQLKKLAEAGLTIHTQIVLVPGYNDGEILEDTVENLADLYPAVQSIGIVPVGLTKHREGLPKLRTVSSNEADKVLKTGMAWQQKYQTMYGKRLVYFSDEFYVLAGRPFPAEEEYDDYPQIENGIGMAAKFSSEIARSQGFIPSRIPARKVHLVTGVSASMFFHTLVQELALVEGLSITVHSIINHYFGVAVTVAGLLTAQDIADQLGDLRGDYFLIPRVMLKADQDIFLDGFDLKWLENKVKGKAVVIENNGKSFLAGLLGKTIGG